jgi:hypothetical protein
LSIALAILFGAAAPNRIASAIDNVFNVFIFPP